MTALPEQSAPSAQEGPQVYTVIQLTRRIKRTLEDGVGSVWVVGEISNLSRPASGHVYFTLKDEYAQLSAVMWRSTAARLRFELEPGLEVLLFGAITVYEPRGSYQIIVERIEPKGMGALQLAFLQLRQKLEAEGLFAPERKKPLPFLPRRIALVTSPSGAVVWDMINTITDRIDNVEIVVYPVSVQGATAAQEIAAAIEHLNRLGDVDVMIVGRGGGSLEDLWAFNEEIVARAIYASAIPVISAVGHEVDVTISDLVADRRALTPTDAGQIVVPRRDQLLVELQTAARRLANALAATARSARHRLAAFASSALFRRPLEQVRFHQQRLDELTGLLRVHAEHRVQAARAKLDTTAARLESLSPLSVLRRGYSITLDASGTVVKTIAALRSGDRIDTRLLDGTVQSRVEKIDRSSDQPETPLRENG